VYIRRVSGFRFVILGNTKWRFVEDIIGNFLIETSIRLFTLVLSGMLIIFILLILLLCFVGTGCTNALRVVQFTCLNLL